MTDNTQSNLLHPPGFLFSHKKLSFFSRPDILLLSHGRTACHWLAAAINEHPEMLCTLSVFAVPTFENSVGDPTHEDERLRFSDIVSAQEPMEPDEYFAVLRQFSKKKIYCNVHKYTATSFWRAWQDGIINQPYFVLDLIRHPIERIESNTRFLSSILSDPQHRIHQMHWDQSKEFFKNSGFSNIFASAIQDMPLDREDPRQVAFCRSIWTIFVEVGEQSIPVQRLSMEKFTRDRDFFRRFLKMITRGKVRISRGYLDRVFSAGRVKASGSASAKVDEVIESWSPQERAIYACLAQTCDLEGVYAKHGYKLPLVTV